MTSQVFKDSFQAWTDEVLGTVDMSRPSYAALAESVGRWLDGVERRLADGRSEERHERQVAFDRLERWLARRGFPQFRAAMRPRGTFESALFELFLQTRARLYVLAYLSVQEGEDFEGAAEYDTRAPKFLSQLLRRLGSRTNLEVRPKLGPFRFRFDGDPLASLRRAYAVVLRRVRQDRAMTWRDRAALFYHRTAFRAKTWFLQVCGRRWFASASGSGGRVGSRGAVRGLAATGILLLFPDAERLDERQWEELFSRLEGYFSDRLHRLLEVIPAESLRDHGLIKLAKVAFGTIVGRTAAREAHESDSVDFIVDTLRAAYAWGVTYPLVDNVLDSSATAPELRRRLSTMLRSLFEDTGEPRTQVPPQPGDPVDEVRSCLEEMLSLVPSERLDSVRRWLGMLLESHHRDSRRRLSRLVDCASPDIAREVLVDTALKSALVRLTTMEICGIPVDGATAARAFSRALFNQLGDDLWDVYEDAADDRVTPFTLYLTRRVGDDPFERYLGYAWLLARGQSKRRACAAWMGACETLRDSLLALDRRSNDSLGVAVAIRATMQAGDGEHRSGLVRDVPHVDFDAVLFAFERAAFETLSFHDVERGTDARLHMASPRHFEPEFAHG